MWYEAAAGSNRELYVTRPQPKLGISAIGWEQGQHQMEGGVGPRGALSSDTRLASLLVLSEEGAPEHLAPSFSPGISTYRNAVALPSHASTVNVIARARDPAAMVSIYRYDPAADPTTQRAVEHLARAVLVAPHWQTDEQRAAATVQAASRGAAIRRQLTARGDLTGRRTGRRAAGATAGEACAGVTPIAIFTGTPRQRAQRAAAVAAEAGVSHDRALAAFAQADKDKSGSLSKRELRAALGHLGVQLTRPELSAQLASCDADSDGFLTGDEFAQLACSLVASHSHIRRVFTTHDRDGSGGLSKRELRSALRSLGLQLTGEEARRTLACHDADASGSLSIAEFATLVRSLAAASEAEESENGGAAAGATGPQRLWQRAEEALTEREQASGGASCCGVAIASELPELCLADMAARAMKRWMRANLATLTSFFLRVDRDGSGAVDRTELRLALQALRFECTEEEVRRRGGCNVGVLRLLTPCCPTTL
jgi:Ca2+-binding EF-hand superfamily protein